jgi:hypothetical protein
LFPLEVWQRGLMQWIANPPMYLSASVGSNPTTSVGSIAQSGRARVSYAYGR